MTHTVLMSGPRWPRCPSQSSRSAAAPLRFAPPGDSAAPLVLLLTTAAREPCRR